MGIDSVVCNSHSQRAFAQACSILFMGMVLNIIYGYGSGSRALTLEAVKML